MLTIDNVVKRFNGFTANDHISFKVSPGRIFGLLGPNGAGKTTLIRMITNILQPDEGSILLEGAPVTQLAMERIGYLPEERGLYKKLTVGEQITYFGRLKGLSTREAQRRGTEWLNRLDAAGWEGKKVHQLSKGMQQKVQFITTIMHEPSLVILDEPFSGLDPVNAQLLIDTVRSLQKADTTVILSTHQMDQVEKLCDDIALIHRGRVVLNGSVRDVKAGHRSDRVVIEYHGDDAHVRDIDGTEVANASAGRVELRLTSDSVTSDQLLRTLIDRVSIVRFEVAEPSLHDIFVQAVTT
jgi:ABC-2 type transport system ATP-binding protein